MIFTYDMGTIEDMVKELKNIVKECAIITFEGDLGAGKTTVIRYLLQEYGVFNQVMSPTFNYVHEHYNDQQSLFYHFDLYRVKTMRDFLVAGFEDYFYRPNALSFIEWPEVIYPLLQELEKERAQIKIYGNGSMSRKLELILHKK